MFPLRVQTIDNVDKINFLLIESYKTYNRHKLVAAILGAGAQATLYYFDRDDNNNSSYLEISSDELFRYCCKKSKKMGDSYASFKGEPENSWNIWLIIQKNIPTPFLLKKERYICQKCLKTIKGILLKHICIKFILQL